VAQWEARLTRNQWIPVVSLSPIKGSRCFLEQETLPSLVLVLVGSRNGFKRDLQKPILLVSLAIGCVTDPLWKL